MKLKPIREIRFNKRILLFLVLIGIVGWLVLFGADSFLTNFTGEQQLTLVLLMVAVYLWIFAPIPAGASSMLILALMLLLNLVETAEEALTGFLSPALYFIFALSIVSKVLVKVGIDQVIAGMLKTMSKGSPRNSIIGLPFFILLLPIILPSAIARFKMLLPLVNGVNKMFGFSEKSVFRQYSIYIIGMLNQIGTMVVITGGGFSVLTAQLLRDYNVAELGWVDWFILVAPPIWIGSVLMVVIVLAYLKFANRHEEDQTTELADEVKVDTKELLTRDFWIVLVSFLAMIIAWIVTDQEQVPLLLPPMLLIAFYALPGLRLVTDELIRGFDWENFLLLGTSFSLGFLLASNGTADVLASVLFEIIPEDSQTITKIIAFSGIVFVLRFFFIVPSSAVIVIFPIVLSYSELIGIPTIDLALIVFVIIGSMMILPIHTPTVFLAFETGVISRQGQTVIGLLVSLAFTVIAILASLYYW